MRRYDIFKRHMSPAVKHKQVLVLHYLGYAIEDISNIVGYAIRTIKRIITTTINFSIEESKKIFLNVPSVGVCYLFKFYDEEGFCFSKIGATTRNWEKRLAEEEKEYSRKHYTKGEVRGVKAVIVNCGKYPPEGMESFVRAYFIKKYPQNFVPNDRFMGINIPNEEFTKIARAYLEE